MNDTVWIFVEFAFAGISIVLTYLFLRSFLKQRRVEFGIFNCAIAVFVLATKFLASLFFSNYIVVISSVAIVTAFLMSYFFFDGKKITWSIVSAILSAIAGAVVELLAVIVITNFQSISLSEIMQFGIYRLAGRTLSYLFFLIIVIVVGKIRKSSITLMTTKLLVASCILPLVSVLIIQQFTMHIVDTSYIPNINEIIPMLSIIIVNIFVFILIENIIRQNEKSQALILIESQCDAQQKHITQLLDNHEQIRQISHDFKQQATVLYRLCKEKQYNELLRNLSELSNHHDEQLIVKTGNLLLDTILSSKKEEAKKHGIKFECNLNVQPELQYMSMDICILLGNAMDNAIEACMCSGSDTNKNIIELELTADSSCFQLYIKNNIGDLPQVNGEFLKTKKSNTLLHGIGLQSIKQISNRLGGDMTYEYDNEQFIIWIYLSV